MTKNYRRWTREVGTVTRRPLCAVPRDPCTVCITLRTVYRVLCKPTVCCILQLDVCCMLYAVCCVLLSDCTLCTCAVCVLGGHSSPAPCGGDGDGPLGGAGGTGAAAAPRQQGLLQPIHPSQEVPKTHTLAHPASWLPLLLAYHLLASACQHGLIMRRPLQGPLPSLCWQGQAPQVTEMRATVARILCMSVSNAKAFLPLALRFWAAAGSTWESPPSQKPRRPLSSPRVHPPRPPPSLPRGGCPLRCQHLH